MRPANDYPSKGQNVPFLFGQADRNHLLESGMDCINALERCNRPVVHYWDGRKLSAIDFGKARGIYAHYMVDVRREWAVVRRPQL
jgi:hypothetical protein